MSKTSRLSRKQKIIAMLAVAGAAAGLAGTAETMANAAVSHPAVQHVQASGSENPNTYFRG